MATEHSSVLDQSVPQWKRELILRRRAVGRVLPAGSGSVQLTCPSVVAAVRHPESSVSVGADFHLRRCASEREQTGAECKNMRLVEPVNATGDFVEPGVIPDIKELMTNGSKRNYSKMGEEKNISKKNGTGNSGKEKKSGEYLEEDQLSDSSEEFKYGPGIVSKLKSKYLSLTLRESQGKVRPSLSNMRRATSLENILDDGQEAEKPEEPKTKYVKKVQPAVNGNSPQRCRAISRGNKDSMKRARSVEALMRYDRGGGTIINNRRSFEVYSKVEEEETKENSHSRNRFSLEEKELPPPDVVKHTLKIFENTSKKTASTINKTNSVTKSVSESNSISANKPLISPKPVLSGNKIKENGANASPIRSSSDAETSPVINNIGEMPGKNKFSEKNMRTRSLDVIHKEAMTTPPQSPEKKLTREKSPKNKIIGEKPSPTERQKLPTPIKETTKESVILKKPSIESKLTNSGIQDCVDGESNLKLHLNNSPPKDQLTLDLKDTNNIKSYLQNNKQKSSPLNVTSPKTNEKKSVESPESIRPISPVLVRAPPSILSSELGTNISNSPTQHMKQVGVIRPIITNKSVNSNVTFPSKYPVSKSHSNLTEREIEKNLINKVKSIEQPVTKVIVSLKKSPEECIMGNVNNESNKQNEETKKGLTWDKKPNTMVFNFSNRKTVPDYIENDGLILASRKEKPKRGEPGIIFLGGSTDDSSTDFDPEEFASDPPSPCDIIFEGDNILINGKSNIQLKPKQRKLKIQFNDEATTMFEYPSEVSLLDEHEPFNMDEIDRNIPSGGANSPGLPNPFRCGNLASYTPSKLSMTSDFQLGVTKSPIVQPPPPPPPSTASREDNSDVEDDYLRPADENDTVTWSAETAADLLF